MRVYESNLTFMQVLSGLTASEYCEVRGLIIDLVLETDLSRHFEFLSLLRTCASLHGQTAYQQRIHCVEHRPPACSSFRRSLTPADRRSSIRRGSVEPDALSTISRGSALVPSVGRRDSRSTSTEPHPRRGSHVGSIKRFSGLSLRADGVEANEDVAAGKDESSSASTDVVLNGQPATEETSAWTSPLLDPAKVRCSHVDQTDIDAIKS